jgi:hypothetical protein
MPFLVSHNRMKRSSFVHCYGAVPERPHMQSCAGFYYAGVLALSHRGVRAHLFPGGVVVLLEAESMAVVVGVVLQSGECGSWCRSVPVTALLSWPSVTTGKAVIAGTWTLVHCTSHA